MEARGDGKSSLKLERIAELSLELERTRQELERTKCELNKVKRDAEVVRHGRWIKASDPKSGRCRPRIRCSECNLIQYGTVSKHSNYCPNCGAKMEVNK